MTPSSLFLLVHGLPLLCSAMPDTVMNYWEPDLRTPPPTEAPTFHDTMTTFENTFFKDRIDQELKDEEYPINVTMIIWIDHLMFHDPAKPIARISATLETSWMDPRIGWGPERPEAAGAMRHFVSEDARIWKPELVVQKAGTSYSQVPLGFTSKRTIEARVTEARRFSTAILKMSTRFEAMMDCTSSDEYPHESLTCVLQMRARYPQDKMRLRSRFVTMNEKNSKENPYVSLKVPGFTVSYGLLTVQNHSAGGSMHFLDNTTEYYDVARLELVLEGRPSALSFLSYSILNCAAILAVLPLLVPPEYFTRYLLVLLYFLVLAARPLLSKIPTFSQNDIPTPSFAYASLFVVAVFSMLLHLFLTSPLTAWMLPSLTFYLDKVEWIAKQHEKHLAKNSGGQTFASFFLRLILAIGVMFMYLVIML